MKQSLALTCGLLLIALPGNSQTKSDPDKKTEDKTQVVSTAEIVKIDAKKKSLQVKEINDSPATPSGQGTGPRTGSPGNGGGGGGRRQGGGGGRYPGGGGGGFPGGGNGRAPGGGGYPGSGASKTPQVKQYKVFVTDSTAMKLFGTDIGFTDLRVGDRITVSGLPKGSDVEATTITREN